jgi:hypothetical protein
MKRRTQAAAKSPALTTKNTETPKTDKVDIMQIIIASIFT